jgi:predicted O-linked N-acetylglucosamine transferase (SPINDLY family)
MPAAASRPAAGADELHRAANADLQRGDAKSALGKLKRAVELAPAQATLHATLARAHFALGAHTDALACARDALALDADHAGALVVLGMGLEASDPDAALSALERAAKLAPHDPEPPFRIGNLQRRRKNAAAAVTAYRVALAEGLRHPVLLNNLGLALDDLGERREAEACLRQALTLQPGMIEAQVNLADVLCKRLRFSEAAPLYRQAVAQQDRVAGLWLNFGLCLYRLGAQASAQRALQRALALEPANVQALTTLAASLLAEQKDAEALPHVAAALERQPDSFEALSMLLYARQRVCDWRDLDQLFERQRAVLRWPDAPAIVPHNLLALPYTPAELRNAAENWVRLRVAPEPVPRPPRPELRDGRLRIAYLGSDFRTHALANLLPEVLERHDRARFEVIGYSFGPDDGSAARLRFERAFDRFVDVREESFEQTAQRIRADGVGVLFDTGGYVLGARSEIFALRPAPLQVNCIGFPGTLGADYYDYIVTDGFVTPPGQEPNFAEAFLLMPHCYLPGDTGRVIDPPPSREACGLPSRGVVFCCFNAAWKIQPQVFSTWMRVLEATPGSVLWLLQSSQASADNLRREAAARGVDPGRLVFAPTLPLPAHLARHACADLFLDTFPCNAHTTANDALFAGLPLLTCAGETFASRVSGSHLRAAGLPELIAADLQDYEAKALLLGSDPALLAACRERLRSERERAPLFDMAAWTRDFESRLLATWDALEA